MFTENDMIFTEKDNKITGGGFEIESSFLNNNIPVSYNLNGGGSFGGLAVPSGLIYLSNHSKSTDEIVDPIKVKNIGTGLYDALLDLTNVNASNKVETKHKEQEPEPEPKPKQKSKKANKITIKSKIKHNKTQVRKRGTRKL